MRLALSFPYFSTALTYTPRSSFFLYFWKALRTSVRMAFLDPPPRLAVLNGPMGEHRMGKPIRCLKVPE